MILLAQWVSYSRRPTAESVGIAGGLGASAGQ